MTRYIQANKLFVSGDTVVVAVSGGADSVALLDFLASWPHTELQLVAAHLNHCLRGDESDGDEEFVVSLARRYGIPCEVRRVDVGELSRAHRLSLEDAGRTVRYAFLDEVAELYAARSVALAHHADDQAETVLMRLLRGSGGSGLAAMIPRSRNGRYVRPFLGVTRTDIEAYLQRKGLMFRHDRSNDDTSFLRNSIRHDLLPLLQRYNPEIVARLSDTAAILAADEELLGSLVASAFDRYGSVGDGCVTLCVTGLQSEFSGLRRRLYRCALQSVNSGLAGITCRHLDAIDGLVTSDAPNAELHLPGGCRVMRCYGEVVIRAHPLHKPVAFAIELHGPGRYPLPCGGCLAVTPVDLLSAESAAEEGDRRVVFDLDDVPFPWLVRSFVPGDRLRPAGMTGTKKVKDLFMERKVPRSYRGRIPLLFQGERLLWVCGLRRSVHAVADSRTRNPVMAEFLGEIP